MSAAPRHLVLVTVDCLRADHLGAYGSTPSPTPYLDRLAAECSLFERAVTAGLPTYYAFPALLASRFPLAFGRDTVGLLPGEETLATALEGGGFATGAFVAGNPYLSTRERYNQGFAHYEDFLSGPLGAPEPPAERERLRHRIRRRLADLAGRSQLTERLFKELQFQAWALRFTRRPCTAESLRRYPAADRVVDGALPWLEEQGERRVFLWLHLMDPHHPYHPPERALELQGRGDLRPERSLFLNALWGRGEISPRRRARHREELLALYAAGVRWVDHQVERLVVHLKEKGLWDETLFVLTADHGEEFLERGGCYHYPVQMGDEVTRVPLLIHDPQVQAERIVEPFSLLDLAPTLVARCGLEIPPSFRGRCRWQGERFVGSPEPVLTECVYNRRNPWQPEGESGARLLAAQDGRYKLVMNFATEEESFFDLKTDPRELTPWPADRSHPARGALLRAMREHLQSQRPNFTAESWQRSALVRLELRLRRERVGVHRSA